MVRRSLFLFVAFLLGAGLAFPQGQSYGRLEGVVRDAQGLVLPGVSVSLTGAGVMGARTATTGVDGSYRFLALPPGTYNMVFELSGFQTLNREGIIVTTGSTFTINVNLEIATVAETITVTGESPVVDVKTTGITATFDTAKLQEVPSATDMWSVLHQTPGVRMKGYDVGGSHKSQQTGYDTFGVQGQNRIINEGVNTTEGTSAAGGYYDYYAIQEFQVSAQGADVEMSTPGAQVVATTKSGGNEFSGLYHIDYEPSGFVTDNIDSSLEARGGTSAPVRKFWEGHVDLGGPIVKDKLWFYGAYNHFFIDRVISGQDPAVATDIGIFDMYTIKLNWQISKKDQFIGYTQWDLKQKPYRGLSLNIPAESIRAQASWDWLHKAEWQRVWNDRVFSNVMVGHFGFGWPMVPAVDPNEKPARIDTATNNQRGAGWQPFTWYRYKPQSTGQVSYYVPDKAGSHDFKFGWDWQIDSSQFGWNTNSGTLRYRDNSNLGSATTGAPGQLGQVDEIDFFNVPTLNDDRNQHTDLYAQDVWTVSDRMTLTIGARFGRQSLYYLGSSQTPVLTDFFQPVDSQGQSVRTWNNVAPRLGVTIDVTGEGKTVLKGYYGRYYGNVGSGLSGANPAGQQQLRYKFLDQNNNGVYDGMQELGDFVDCFGTCGEGAGTPVDPNTKLMYSDEFSFTLEKELVADTSVRFSYVRKQTRNNWYSSALYTLNRARATDLLTQNVTATCDGCPGSFNGQTLNLRTLPDGAPTSDVAYTNAPGNTDGNYDTIQFAFNRRMRGNFFFNASFDYQWRNEMRSPSSEGTSNLSADPIQVYWFPEYNRDVTLLQKNTNWNFQTQARYILPYEVGLAGTFRYVAGWPWAPVHRLPLANVGTQPFFLENIDQNRSDNVALLDIRLDKTFNLTDKFRVSGFFDIYNVFNSNPETNFIIRTGGSFDNIIEWIQGRTFKIGARFQF